MFFLYSDKGVLFTRFYNSKDHWFVTQIIILSVVMFKKCTSSSKPSNVDFTFLWNELNLSDMLFISSALANNRELLTYPKQSCKFPDSFFFL